ncbi:uncharacterized protein K452DRAFT_161974 [Aplosporella prunicola CBS 121167]|uniref:tRNA-splicing endonuclease subunit Sen2 n=1 Tax=Aplosporella prunicola CBS 121167 TaxID=1176127 RepID=A0A6A6BI15_9PEZI|nr:uncharacterized protein K452DRAFT_161974 [Aplosporella prunicola CBS 121167]KAF2143770.1 hypothetical protein K452DRAFT_161974 [Aplosporella prunicola CBS 121167]
MAEAGVIAPASGAEEPKPVNESQDSQNGTTGPAPKDTISKQDAKPTVQRARRPNYAKIHAQPLPVVVHPLPAFVPHNPLSLLRVAWIIISQYFAPPASHPPARHIGYWSAETRSIHVTDPASVRALWEQGFFGKGSLSRSEPTWLDREQQRKGVLSGRIAAEDYTQVRRKERKEYKNERARKEREALEEQLRREGKLVDAAGRDAAASAAAKRQDALETQAPAGTTEGGDGEAVAPSTEEAVAQQQQQEKEEEENMADDELLADAPIANQEHLQLTLEEAFFLHYGLGVLDIVDPSTNTSLNTFSLLRLCRTHSYFPPLNPTAPLRPDDPFLLKYAAYQHFRSRGWVARDGVKFAVDLMLYNRGPVFSHAEFAAVVLPAYSHAYWRQQQRGEEGREGRTRKEQSPWWWLHCVNRVQAQVLKSLVLVYVEVPPPMEGEGEVQDVGALLRRYKVREFVLRRWVPNRMRG